MRLSFRNEHHAMTFARHAALASLSLALAGPALAEAEKETAGGRVVSAVLNIGGTDYEVDWFLPNDNASALATVQHGFARRCSNLRQTGIRLMQQGLMGLCVNASMAGGNPALAEALAVTLTSGISAPDGRPVPDKLIVGGHSAGGLFASRVGWKLDAIAPQRLRGAVLFDPVAAGPSMTTNLMAVSHAGQRPVLAVTANASSCNAQNNGYVALRQVRADAIAAGRDGFVGVQLTERSTHVDVEGGDTGAGQIACGRPRPANTEALRTLAAQWAADIASGTRTPDVYPGGSYLQGLIDGDQALVIE